MKKILIILLLLFSSVALATPQPGCFTPAERMRGGVWCSNFISEESEEKISGTITGSPEFSPSKGVRLDGSSDYIQYNLSGQEFDSDPISIVIEFTPDFDYDEDQNRYILSAEDGGGSDWFRITKRDNPDNDLLVALGGTTIAHPAISNYWLPDQRNVFVVSSTSGDTDMYINGALILDSDGTAWSPGGIADRLFIGADYTANNMFDGTIHSFKVFHAKLTADEAQQLYDQTTYSYPNTGTTWTFCADTLLSDTAGGNTLSINGGVTKDTLCGYTYNGTTGYLQGAIDTSIFNHDPISIVMVFEPDFEHDEGTARYFWDADDGAGGARTAFYHYASGNDYRLQIGGIAIAFPAEALFANAWRVNQTNVLVLSATSGNTDLYLNQQLIVDSDSTAWSASSDTDRLAVGGSYAGTGEIDGSIMHLSVHPVKLTQLQVHDITARVRRQCQRR